MKNKLLLLVVLLFSWMSVGVAAVVPADVAAEKAKEMLSHRCGSEFKGGKSQVETVMRGDKPAYYIVRFEQGGWAMMSAEDTTEPLLGYSSNGEIPAIDQLPSTITDWFDGYVNQIEGARKISSLARHYRWDNDNNMVTRAEADRIAPLIKVKWNQTAPYNKYCPTNEYGQAVVGCVAVGMAQALSVVRFPLRGTGTKSYTDTKDPMYDYDSAYGPISVNFDKEPDYNWDAMLASPQNDNEVARLLFHCGVIVEMNYGHGASGTMTDYVAEAFQQYYGFPESCVVLARRDYSESQWNAKMIEELKRGRAIIYAGQNSEAGHCFNVDGYDGENMFHVNWGWGGMSDSWFLLNNLTPANQGTGGSASGYNEHQRAVVGVAPLAETPYDIRLSTTRVGIGWPAGTYVADVTVLSDVTDAEYDFELRGDKKVVGTGYMEAKYEVRDGRLYTTAEIKNTSAYKMVAIKATNKNSGHSFEKEFRLNLEENIEPSIPGAIDEVLADELKLYPVPATDVLTIEAPAEGEYAIFNVAGMLMQQGELVETVSTLDISALSKGSYILRYSTAKGVAMKSFIVK